MKTIPIVAALAAVSATPAYADHVGPGSVGAGAGMTVFSPATLDEQQWAMGLRLLFTRPEQRSDAELEALAGSTSTPTTPTIISMRRPALLMASTTI